MPISSDRSSFHGSLTEVGACTVRARLGQVGDVLGASLPLERVRKGSLLPDDSGLYVARRQLSALRVAGQIVAPAEPVGSTVLGDLNRVASAGYSAMGAFRDLFAAESVRGDGPPQYDPVRLARCLEQVRTWRESITPEMLAEWDAAIARWPADPKETQGDSASSRFFWKGEGAHYNPKRSAGDNLRQLESELARRAEERVNGLSLLVGKKPAKQELGLHEARKAMRALVAMHQVFPDYRPEVMGAVLDGWVALVARLGEVHDRMVWAEMTPPKSAERKLAQKEVARSLESLLATLPKRYKL